MNTILLEIAHIATLLLGVGVLWGRLSAGFKALEQALQNHREDDKTNFERIDATLSSMQDRAALDVRDLHHRIDVAREGS